MIRKANLPSACSILTLQPDPVQTLRAAITGQDGVSYTMLVRRWAVADVGRCRLCRHCTAKVGADRQAVCIVAVDGPVPEDQAPLYASVDG